MTNLLIVVLGLFMAACTINMIQTDTHGTASDVVDSDAKANADIKADATIPLKGL